MSQTTQGRAAITPFVLLASISLPPHSLTPSLLLLHMAEESVAAPLDLNVPQQEQENAGQEEQPSSTPTKKIINLQGIKRKEPPLEPLSRIIRLKDIKEKENSRESAPSLTSSNSSFHFNSKVFK